MLMLTALILEVVSSVSVEKVMKEMVKYAQVCLLVVMAIEVFSCVCLRVWFASTTT